MEAMGKNYIKSKAPRAKPNVNKPGQGGKQFRNGGDREENQFAYPSTETYHRECHLCGELHKFGSLQYCKDFLAKSHDEKMSIVNRGKFCISCLLKVSYTRDRPCKYPGCYSCMNNGKSYDHGYSTTKLCQNSYTHLLSLSKFIINIMHNEC